MMQVESREILHPNNDGQERGEGQGTPASVTRLLITCYIFDRFALVIYEFVLIIFLLSVYQDSLLLVSIYGLNAGLLVFFLGGKAGRFFDTGVANNRRLQSVLLILTGQYSCILACCAICYILLKLDDNLGDLSKVLLFLIILLSGFGMLSSEAAAVSIENDWIVVICDNKADYLGSLNVKLRRVHLVSRMVGPIAAGYCLKGFDNKLEPVFLVIGIVALVSFIVKYKCLKRICSVVPALVMQRGDDANMEEQRIVEEEQDQRHCSSCSMIGGYVIYFQQDIALGGLGESLLYLNVMSSGDIMTSYLIWRGLSLNWIGIVRGATAITGLLGTAVFELSAKKYPLRTIATASIAFQVACLSVSFCGTFFVSNGNLSLSMLVVGVIVSRIGLWANDLSIFQLTQHTVHENVRGIVGGSQHSINAFFYALHFTSGIIWADPSKFYILCLLGYSAVIAAFFLMLQGVYFSSAFQNVATVTSSREKYTNVPE
mmetsp:Transcript_22365/g.39397  ORF Transcript_22365/g.39397 Transcript_22365/m.39397 type:complete len:487 (+) Transcript_22365:127-1587(+)